MLKKSLIRDNDNESIYYTSTSEFDDKDKKQQINNIDTKPAKVFNYLKSLSQKAKDLMDEIENGDDDIDDYKLLFIGSNKENFNFYSFDMPLNFLSNIYNGKISLKEAEFKQRDLEKIIYELQFNYTPKNKREKEEVDGVLMQAKDLVKYRNKLLGHLKMVLFLSEHLKKSDDAAYNYVLKDVNKFIEEIKSMEEKINLSLFEDFFEFSSPVDCPKELINTSPDKNKKTVAQTKDKISDLDNRIEQMSDKEKKYKNANETLEIINKIVDYNNMLKIFFIVHQKLIKKITTKD